MLARYLAERIAASDMELQLMAPVALNIVCFRYRGPVVGRDDRCGVIGSDGAAVGGDGEDMTRVLNR